MDWTALRNEFPVARHWAYLDHAAVAPLSGRARRALDAWADHLTENGVVNHAQWPRRAEEVRGLAASQKGDIHVIRSSEFPLNRTTAPVHP